jgi:tetratricopeptide (TPR) repeat protein
MTAQKITIHGFLNEFKRRHEQMTDRPFCWILGSGASIQSGIPSGKDLALQWLSELHQREDFNSLPIDEWATPENLDIPDFEYSRADNFYPWIYQRRFRDYKEQGYVFLERTMDHAEPSFGYSVLAQLMAQTSHNVAVTTNFDNLIADALSIYTRTFPVVCGHESLAGYIRPNLRRPLVAKVHRDLLHAPLTFPDEIARLPGQWATALRRIFDRFTPIVIGYGGNDSSLMWFLKTLVPIEGGIFWCYQEGSKVDPKILEVVDQHHGLLVPIAGFDELMLQLQEKLQLPFLLPQLQNIQEKRAARYQKQFEALTTALRKPAETPAAEEARKPARKAAEAAVERVTKEKDWWAWQLRAEAEPDLGKREAVFRTGLEEFPESPELTGNFALFMHEIGKNYDEAERFYRLSLELNPNDATVTGNFALFMHEVRKNSDEAERLYRRALDLDPNLVANIGRFAVFMAEVRKNYDEAEGLYRKALELDPGHPSNTVNFALFMENVRENYEEAERLYRKALERDPNDTAYSANFARFQETVHKNYYEAEQFYLKALELNPDQATNPGNFALFMEEAHQNFAEAERLYRRTLGLRANAATVSGGTGLFYSTFISYSSKDEEFARKLNSHLRGAQIRVWFAPEDIKGGKKVDEQIEHAIKIYDKLLIVLSDNSLQSNWVMTELRKAFKHEGISGKRKLFPVSLVDFSKIREWECFDSESGKDLAAEVRSYFIPDFSQWKDENLFEGSLGRLLDDLKSEGEVP